MANLSKVKALFGFTSPRTIEKIIPEIQILSDNFEGKKWSGNEELQAAFFQKLFDTEYYEGETFPTDPALAARDRITRAPKAFGFVDFQPNVKLTQVGKLLLTENRLDETFTRQLLKFQLPSPYHTQSKTVDFAVKPYLELLRLIKDAGSLSKDELDKKIDQLLVSSGYTMKEGQIGHAMYTKGNRVMRILFGAFVKYFKFTIGTGGSSDSDEIKLAVRQESSGMSGGLIGMNQVKNELIRLGQILQTI